MMDTKTAPKLPPDPYHPCIVYHRNIAFNFSQSIGRRANKKANINFLSTATHNFPIRGYIFINFSI